MIKATTIIALCLFISASAISQNYTSLSRESLGIGQVWVGSTSGIVISKQEPKYDTVDVIALVSDTTNYPDKMYCLGKPGDCYKGYDVWCIKIQAVRESVDWLGLRGEPLMAIKEYLLPKKYIVWQAVIINH